MIPGRLIGGTRVNTAFRFVAGVFFLALPLVEVKAAQGQAKDDLAEERQLLEAMKRGPANAQAMGALGEWYVHHEQWRKSLPWLAKAYALTGDEAIGYDLAYAREQAGDLAGAQDQTERMLEQKETAKLHALLAEVKDRRGDARAAMREYYRAAQIDSSEQTVFDLATFLLQHKQYVGGLQDSIKFFRYGVQQYPQSSRMRVGLGVALYADSNYDKAVKVLCAAVDLDPTDRRPIEFLGRAREVSPELAVEVDRRLRDFVERYPESAATNYFYAVSLWDRGNESKNLEEIETLLKKAERISPDWYEPYYQLGVVYQSESRYAEAIKEMRRTVEIDSEFYPAHYRLAMLYKRAGDIEMANAEAALVKQLKSTESEQLDGHEASPRGKKH
jgi:tetratricopeptide (TPR) repeat protein